jgi:hypothetical protein
LREEGVKDFSGYLASKDGREEDLMPDFFLDEFLEIEQKHLGNGIKKRKPFCLF